VATKWQHLGHKWQHFGLFLAPDWQLPGRRLAPAWPLLATDMVRIYLILLEYFPSKASRRVPQIDLEALFVSTDGVLQYAFTLSSRRAYPWSTPGRYGAQASRLKWPRKLFILLLVSGSAKPRQKGASTHGKLIYRGVTLQKLAKPSRFSTSEIRKAVEDAVAKNTESLTRRE
jgi:hypothetical protein